MQRTYVRFVAYPTPTTVSSKTPPPAPPTEFSSCDPPCESGLQEPHILFRLDDASGSRSEGAYSKRP
jgi:hypothetical protein